MARVNMRRHKIYRIHSPNWTLFRLLQFKQMDECPNKPVSVLTNYCHTWVSHLFLDWIRSLLDALPSVIIKLLRQPKPALRDIYLVKVDQRCCVYTGKIRMEARMLPVGSAVVSRAARKRTLSLQVAYDREAMQSSTRRQVLLAWSVWSTVFCLYSETLPIIIRSERTAWSLVIFPFAL